VSARQSEHHAPYLPECRPGTTHAVMNTVSVHVLQQLIAQVLPLVNTSSESEGAGIRRGPQTEVTCTTSGALNVIDAYA
jgi:hypothetical protein